MERAKRARRDWSEVVAAQAGSGLSASAYCRQAGVPRSLFYRWRQRLRGGVPAAAGFVQLELREPPAGSSGVVLVSPQGWRVEVDRDFDGPTLERVCACLPEAACWR